MSFSFRISLLAIFIVIANVVLAQNREPAKDAPVLKIAVFSDGRVTVDGNPSSIEMLKTSLKTLAEHHGVVWYYRESAQHDPPPIAMQILKEVVAMRLPIRLSSKPDYFR